MGNILDQIVRTKHGEVAAAKQLRPLDQVRAAAQAAPPPRDFYGRIASPAPLGIHVIAEIKRKSPSAGLIRPDFDPVALARIYHDCGASALSVLTDETYFDGRLAYLEQVRAAVPLPVLRKDFMVNPYQIYEARAAGADAILLIGEVLAPGELSEMLDLACSLGMTSLIEVHEETTLERLLERVPFPNGRRSLLGINNRNLKLQKTDLATTETLGRKAGTGTLLVAESGVKSRQDVERMRAAGASAILIGETLMRSDDISAKFAELFG